MVYSVTLSPEAGSFSYSLHLILEGFQPGDCWIAGLVPKGRISLFHALYDGDIQQLYGTQQSNSYQTASENSFPGTNARALEKLLKMM